ncbi:hypothetical protein V1505DRAFT_168744, partial [Lipomyces doorenjongii]
MSLIYGERDPQSASARRASQSMDSDYREALRLLKDNPPEQRLEIHMPLPMYVRLQDAYSELKLETNISDDQRYPYLSYNSL